MSGLRIALLYNLKHSVKVAEGAPEDALAEYDSEETVEGLRTALEAGGHRVFPLEGDESLLDSIRQVKPDICFNICEGIRGDARESHVPALLEMLGIPYTASKVLTHAISLDKIVTKRIWRDCGLPTAPFQVFQHGDEPLEAGMAWPLFVKPSREGTGMGINLASVVRDEAALRAQVRWVIGTYRQPALVEAYLPGREFTVGLVGNRLAPGEAPRSAFYDALGYHVFPVLEIDVSNLNEPGLLYTGYIKSKTPMAPRYLCPAPIEQELADELRALAVRAFEAIGSLDVARVDFRLNADGQPCLLEINTLPGMNPTISDIVLAANGEAVPYNTLVQEVLGLALHRYGMDGAVRQVSR
jgi:D-alanine-D-alanine ligase